MISYELDIKNITDGDADNELYHLFSRSRYLTFRAREKELQRYDLTPEQAQVLFTVKAMNNKITPAELSRLLLREPHSVSALVDRMAKKGLVKKVKDLERQNLIRVALTEKGYKAFEMTTLRGPIHRIMNSLSEEEKESFRNCLEKIADKARQELGMDQDNLPLSDYRPDSE